MFAFDGESLDIELAKPQLLTKHISSSANSLDEIALSLDKDVNIFKLDIPGKNEKYAE